MGDVSPPDIYETFYPAPEKYITIQNSSGFDSKNYDLWQDVIDYILPEFNKLGIKILQIGDAKSPQLNGVIRLCGGTSVHQSNYLIRRAKLHMGNDSSMNYLTAFNDTPLISVYGPTRIENHSPFHLPKKHKLFISHRNGKMPNFAPAESPKTVNFITPESIANGIFELLEIDSKIELNTVYLGKYYLGPSFELVPDHIIHDNVPMQSPLIIRGDEYFNAHNIYTAIMKYKSVVVVKEPLDCSILKQLAPNIHALSAELTLDTPRKYVKEMKEIGCQVIFYSKDEENIGAIRNKFYADTLIELSKTYRREDFINEATIYCGSKVEPSLDKCLFKTHKIVLSRGEAFASIEHAKRGIKIKDINHCIDSDDFIKEIEKFKILC
jgi:hypothetical protein